MFTIGRAAIPRLRLGARVLSQSPSVGPHTPSLINPSRRYFQNPSSLSNGLTPPPSKRRVWLRRSYTVVTTLLAIYGLYSIYDEVSVLVHQAERLPLYYSRLQRAIAREVDMDDIDEAMDHFLDIFESAFNTRMGFREPVHDDIVEQLETMTFATKHVGSEPDISNALVVLIKQACADIRSVRLAKWDEEDNFDFDAQEDSIFEIHQTVLKHAIKMSKFIVPKLIERAAYQAEQEGTEEVQEETMRIESEGVGTKPKESEWTSID